MADPFASARGKLKRGKELLDALYAEVMEALERDPVIIDGETDSDRPTPPILPDGTLLKGFTIKVIHAPRIPRESGYLVGEIVHNFRSAFDHLAWALVKNDLRFSGGR